MDSPLGRLEVALVGEPLRDLGNTLLDSVLVGLDGNLRVRGGLVGRRDAGKVLDLTSAGLFVQALGVALLGNLEGHVDVDLDKGDVLVVLLLGLGVEVPGEVPVGAVGTDEGGDGDGGRVGEELGYLGDAADVLVAVLLGEAEVLVEAEADVVAVEAVGGHAEVQEVLLQGGGNGGLARGGEAGEPEGEALLLAELVALPVGEGGVPGDVAGGRRRRRRRRLAKMIGAKDSVRLQAIDELYHRLGSQENANQLPPTTTVLLGSIADHRHGVSRGGGPR
jgi:hypothetical protein